MSSPTAASASLRAFTGPGTATKLAGKCLTAQHLTAANFRKAQNGKDNLTMPLLEFK